MSPAAPASLPVTAEPISSLPAVGIQSPAHKDGGTVLLVDDDPLLLESTHALVEQLGFTVLIATDGFKAVEVFQRHRGRIRCVIAEVMMPHMDGWDTLSALRRLEPLVPVVLASTCGKADVCTTAHPDRPNAFLEKPIRLCQLRDALALALGLACAEPGDPVFEGTS